MIQVLLWKGENPSNTKASEIVVQYKETTQFRQVYRILIGYHRAQPRVNDARLLAFSFIQLFGFLAFFFFFWGVLQQVPPQRE